ERRRHGGALDVPAGAGRSPGRLPGRLAGLRALPEHEVERITLGLVHLDARPGAQVLEALAGQPPVGGEARARVHDVAVARDIGIVAGEQLAHHGDDLGHVLRGARLVLGTGDAELLAILVHGGDEALGELARRLAILGRAADDLVVD